MQHDHCTIVEISSHTLLSLIRILSRPHAHATAHESHSTHLALATWIPLQAQFFLGLSALQFQLLKVVTVCFYMYIKLTREIQTVRHLLFLLWEAYVILLPTAVGMEGHKLSQL